MIRSVNGGEAGSSGVLMFSSGSSSRAAASRLKSSCHKFESRLRFHVFPFFSWFVSSRRRSSFHPSSCVGGVGQQPI